MELGSNPQMQLKVNPFEYPAVKCPECENEFFVPAVMFRQVPGILLGSDEKTISLPMKVYVCSKCGALSPDDRELIEKEEKLANAKTKSSLII